jgi:hypothetical protein
MFSRTKNKLGMPALTFHDLRGTVASDLQDAGCTEAQITAVTGHKLIKNEVLDRNYLRRNLALARPAIALLEAYRSGEQSFPKYVQPIDFIEPKSVVWKTKPLLLLFKNWTLTPSILVRIQVPQPTLRR